MHLVPLLLVILPILKFKSYSIYRKQGGFFILKNIWKVQVREREREFIVKIKNKCVVMLSFRIKSNIEITHIARHLRWMCALKREGKKV